MQSSKVKKNSVNSKYYSIYSVYDVVKKSVLLSMSFPS